MRGILQAQSRAEGRDYLEARVLEGEHARYGPYLRRTGPR